jgi:nicotinamide mononucleotide adenylyltransferase
MLGTEKEYTTYSNVTENYNYFRSCINEQNFEIILRGLNRLIFVEISLERDKDDPQRIFESLNSTGLDLSQSDLIRNFILMDLPPKDQNRIYETIWNPIEENAKDIVKQSSLVSDFIRDYLTLRNKKIPNKNKVYAEFKSLYTDKKEDAYHQELENIKSLSVHYKKLVNPSIVSDTSIRRELEYINRLEINVAYPFLLQVFEDVENGLIGKEDLIKILKLIQSYAWRRFIVGLPTNALNKIFMSLYGEVDTEEYYVSIAKVLLKKKGSAKFPTNEDLKTALKDKDLYNTQPKNRNYLFEMLENYNNREYVNTNNELITIEHIFPRNPNDDWSSSLSSEEYFLFKEKHLNTIGNLTLSGNNGALSNKSFLDKKEMNKDGNEQGYNYSRLWLNNYLKTLDNWDVSKYEERLNIIYDRFLKIWEYPNVILVDNDDLDEQNIFDAESPRNKKLEYYIFENTKIEEDTISRMYIKIIQSLYENNSQLLVSNQDIFKMTRNSSDFRTPEEVINGWYVETNMDSNNKFINLKKLLTLFEMEDELFVKYSSDTESSSDSNRFAIRKKYWKQLLPLLKDTDLFLNVNPSKDHWLSTGAGKGGVSFTFVATKSYVRIELTITTSSKETNKIYFQSLLRSKEQIEQIFGGELAWEELPENKMSRIKIELQGVSLYNDVDWERMNSFLVLNLPKFEKALQPFIKKLR